MNKTNFFKELNSLILTGETVNITIRKNSDIELVVSVQPLSKVKDDGAKQLIWFIEPLEYKGIAFLKIEKDDGTDMRMWLPNSRAGGAHPRFGRHKLWFRQPRPSL